MNDQEEQALAFFERQYRFLRNPYQPMGWMRRLFLRLVRGQAPALIDLPTGTGKTELIAIWLVALAWYGQSRRSRSAIPRRLVWIVNRRVLVQQAYELSEQLAKRLAPADVPPPSDADLRELRQGLAKMCRENTKDVFRVVQLRGQLVDDREWSLDPTLPQLIIGTVDQIGSRLLFQGYGLGKWSRPLHAAILGVDAWICLDEAHLVPAFAVTLRQTAEAIGKPMRDETARKRLGPLFSNLPFWLTELSATPALRRPPDDHVLSLADDDEADDIIADRLLAARTRQVVIDFCKQEDLAERITTAARALLGTAGTVAIFCQTVKTVEAVAKVLRKDPQIGARHLLLVTGRLRGYERDRLRDTEAFKAFRRSEGGPAQSSERPETFYLVGTAAAEVGLDADSDVILCDFAPIPTLLQRLGRLDRRGVLSRQAERSQGAVPTMTVFAARSPSADHDEALVALAAALNASQTSAEVFAAFPWRQATKEGKDAAREKTDGIPTEALVDSATWKILLPTEAPSETVRATQPSAWLAHDLARITVGPVVVPPLTDSVLQQWAATTIAPNQFLPVHPWLYGLLPGDRGMPLVGVAFRVEMDLLQHAPSASDDENSSLLEGRVLRAFKCFPPLRAELHSVPMPKAREWLASDAAKGLRIAHFDGDEWAFILPNSALRPDDILVFATSVDQDAVRDLLQGCSNVEDASCDVFDGVSRLAPKYRRQVEFSSGAEWTLLKKDGTQRFARTSDLKKAAADEESLATIDDERWRPAKSAILRGELSGTAATIRYWSRKRSEQRGQLLSLHETAARDAGTALAAALSPDDGFLGALLPEAGALHDEGKNYPPWQRAMGNDDPAAPPIAKPKRELEHPASTHGYRHEWGSLLATEGRPHAVLHEWADTAGTLWLDLRQHLIGAHHGHLRPSFPDKAFRRDRPSSKQVALRLEAVERSARLQTLVGPWRLAYLESLLKTIDVEASRRDFEDEMEETDER